MGDIFFMPYEPEIWEKEDSQWSDFPYWKARAIEEEAYAEKAFRECPEHRWALNLDFGSVSVTCERCDADYSLLCGDPDYTMNLNGTVSISINTYVDRNYEGSVTDRWLEVQ